MPALIAGNGVVLKPDNKSTLYVAYGVSLLYEAGLPEGLFQIVCGEGPDIGPHLIDNADYVMFTGSTATGRYIGAQAGQNLIGCTLELGGKNPLIVLEDANLDEAIPGAVFGTFLNAGQACMHIERIYVPEKLRGRVHRRSSSQAAEAIERRCGLRLRARRWAPWSRSSSWSGSSRTSRTPSPRAPPC